MQPSKKIINNFKSLFPIPTSAKLSIEKTLKLNEMNRHGETIRFSRNELMTMISTWAVKRCRAEYVKEKFKMGCAAYYHLELLSGVLLKLSEEDFRRTEPNLNKEIWTPSQWIVSDLSRIDEMVNNNNDRLWQMADYLGYRKFIQERYGVEPINPMAERN